MQLLSFANGTKGHLGVRTVSSVQVDYVLDRADHDPTTCSL